MKFKSIMLVTFLLLAILTVGAVSASDGADNMTATESQDSIESGTDDVDIIADDEEPDVYITDSIYYEDEGDPVVRYYFPENATGSLNIYVDESSNASYSSEITTGKWVDIYGDDLEGFEFIPGSYAINVVYPGNDYYGIFKWESTLEITAEEDEPVSADYNLTFGEYHNFNQEVVKGRGTYDASFEFPLIAEGNVTVYLDDKYYGVEDVDIGDVFIEIETDDLALGKHNVKFVYSGDEYFNSSTAEDSFNVTYIRFEVPYVVLEHAGVSGTVALVALPYDATGKVKMTVDGIESADEEVDEGTVIISLLNLSYGNHTVALAYYNGNYPSMEKSFDVECLIKGSQASPDLSVSAEDIAVGSTATVTISMAETFTGNVLLSVGDANYTVNVAAGKATQAVPGLAVGTYDVKVTFPGNADFTSAAASTSFNVKATDISTVNVTLSDTAFTYNAKAQKPTVTLTNGNVLKEGVDYTLGWSSDSPVNAGTYTVTVTGCGNYTGTVQKTFEIKKAANPLAIKAKTAKVKYSAVKKKAQTLAVSKVIKFSKKGQGTLTYAKSSGNKKIAINKKTGKVTVKKGLKKGTYKVNVKVKAAGNANYSASAYKTVTFKIKVK